MSKTSSAKYHQITKEKVHKKTCERYQNLSKEEKQKKRQYDPIVTKISQRMKNKS